MDNNPNNQLPRGQSVWHPHVYDNDPDAVGPGVTTNWAGPGEYEVVRIVAGQCLSTTAYLRRWEDYLDEATSEGVKLVTPDVRRGCPMTAVTRGPWVLKEDDSELHYRIRGTVLGGRYKIADLPFLDPRTDGGASKREAYENAKHIVELHNAADSLGCFIRDFVWGYPLT